MLVPPAAARMPRLISHHITHKADSQIMIVITIKTARITTNGANEGRSTRKEKCQKVH